MLDMCYGKNAAERKKETWVAGTFLITVIKAGSLKI